MKLPKPFIKDTDEINAIIETPKGSANKYAYDPDLGLFKMTKILPKGLVFPTHFGFIPGTKGEDGDPLDVMIFMDEPSYPGNLVECKVLGVIEAEDIEKGKAIRNDRLVVASVESPRFKAIDSIEQMEKYEIAELVNFCVSYNNLSKKDFKPLKNKGTKTALKLIKKQLDGDH
jgi:inorganic pyrophosphatase